MNERYSTLIEPAGLLQHFIQQPPQGFGAALSASGLPSFVAPFDLTTTLDESVHQRLAAAPGFRYWQRWLRWRTRFVGCTTTEYLPVPAAVDADTLADEIVRDHARDSRLLVIKDLALQSPLLDAAGNTASAALLDALQQRGFMLLEGMPLAWLAIDFDSLDTYLGRLSSSRRKDIRRKLKSRDRLRIECVDTGAGLFADIEQVRRCHALYLQVHAQSLVHFDLLTEAFFAQLLRDREAHGKMFMYSDGDELVGWNLCYVHGGKLIDKYIGFSYPRARECNLYVVSWMYNLQYALDHGLSHYVAGWTDSRIKRQLGASFNLTRHAVWARNPLLRGLLRRYSHWFEAEVDEGG